jgi:hypothetical protein
LKRLPFAAFGALAVADVQGGRIVVTGGEGGTHTRIHASAEQDDGAGWGGCGHTGFNRENRQSSIMDSR